MATKALTTRRGGLDGHTYEFEFTEFDPGDGLAPLASLVAPVGLSLQKGAFLREEDGTTWQLLFARDDHAAGRRECVARQVESEG